MNKNIYIKNLKALQGILKEDINDTIGKTVQDINDLKKDIEDGATKILHDNIDKDKKRFFNKTSQLYEEYLGDGSTIGQISNTVDDLYQQFKQMPDKIGEGIVKVAVSVLAYIGAKKIWKKIDLFGKYAIEDTKLNIDLAMNAKEYSQFSKCMKALKNIQEKKWFKIASYNSEAVNMASNFISDMKAGYIALGIALILTSAILCLALGLLTKPFADIISAIQEKNFKLALQALGKLSVISVLAFPAVFGVILILLASFNFEDQNKAAEIIKKFGPINQQLAKTTLLIGKFANDLIKKIKVSN